MLLLLLLLCRKRQREEGSELLQKNKRARVLVEDQISLNKKRRQEALASAKKFLRAGKSELARGYLKNARKLEQLNLLWEESWILISRAEFNVSSHVNTLNSIKR